MASLQTKNRLSQSLRIYNMVRRKKFRKANQDPATAALPDAELDRAIERSRQALDKNPRANGVRRWLRALVAEKDLRYARRQDGHE